MPKFIDYAIFLVQITILGSYFYVAYIWGDLNAVECKADINSEVPLTSNTSNSYIDVTEYFKIAIRWGFWMSLLTFLRAIIAQVGLCMKKWVLLWCSYVLFAANISILIVLFVLMQVWRWSHAGRVCSGDFLPEDYQGDTSMYLIFEGRFIKTMLIAIYSIMCLSCLSICIVSVGYYLRHRKQDTQVDIRSEGSTVRLTRETAFTRALDPDYEAAMRETSRSEMKKKFFSQETESPTGFGSKTDEQKQLL